jgi:dTDP-glucose 4,6-dehydratase
MKILVTGGAGFIGSALVRHLIANTKHQVLVVDKLTYAGNLTSLASISGHPRYAFSQTDVCDARSITDLFAKFDADAVMHLAAESHVDRSIETPADFIHTNVVGTSVLLNAALAHWRKLSPARADQFRFLHVSTDEVYGALTDEGYFTESTRYDPRSPYSASKAGSDHLVRAWGHTYGLPILITNCSNNYGPHQYPEKLIPLIVIKGLKGEPLPVYGQGQNVRDWLYVQDHVEALTSVLERGRVGETYNIGGDAERRNIDVVQAICDEMDRLTTCPTASSHRKLINFVPDRPGHDFRYAMDFGKLNAELGWAPSHSFEAGLRETVIWFLHNRPWWEPLVSTQKADRRRGLVKQSA